MASSLNSWKDKAISSAKTVETTAWKVLEPVGKISNKLAGHLGMESFYPMPLDKEIEKCARILSTFTRKGAIITAETASQAVEADGGTPGAQPSAPPSADHADRKTQPVALAIPESVLRNAKGVAIFTVFRTGLGFSGAGGSGVVITKDAEGEWGTPSGILIHTVGWGLVAGADIYDVVLVLRDERAVNVFKYPKISVGGELSVAAGPVGQGAMLDAGMEASPSFSYIKSKGLYFGLQLDGTIILTRSDENARFYNNPNISIDTLLTNKLPAHQIPRACMPLWQALYAGEGRPERFGTDQIGEGPTPGDQVLTDEQVEALQQEAKHGHVPSEAAPVSGEPVLPPPAHPPLGPH